MGVYRSTGPKAVPILVIVILAVVATFKRRSTARGGVMAVPQGASRVGYIRAECAGGRRRMRTVRRVYE